MGLIVPDESANGILPRGESWRRCHLDWLEMRAADAQHRIRTAHFSIRYADEAVRLFCENTNPEDPEQKQAAERMAKDWYDFIAREIRPFAERHVPVDIGLGLLGMVKVADFHREFYEAFQHQKAGTLPATAGRNAIRWARITGNASTVFGMGMDGCLLYGNLRDSRYAEAAGNAGGLVGGGLTLYEATQPAGLLRSAGSGILSQMGGAAGTVAWPILVAVAVGWVGSWVIEWTGNAVASARVREGMKEALPGLSASYSKQVARTQTALADIRRMGSAG